MSDLDPPFDAETYRRFNELSRIGRRAAARAQEESRRLGVPNVYSFNGIIHYEQPDGSLSTVDPWHGRNTPPE